jgi:hypothetical protein
VLPTRGGNRHPSCSPFGAAETVDAESTDDTPAGKFVRGEIELSEMNRQILAALIPPDRPTATELPDENVVTATNNDTRKTTMKDDTIESLSTLRARADEAAVTATRAQEELRDAIEERRARPVAGSSRN